MFDFPNNPTVGQGISAPNGVLFVWDGVKWEQGAVPQLYVPMAGGSMTGPLILSQDPVVILGAATKRYVDNAIGAEHGNVVTSFNTRKGDITLINTDVANAGGLLRAGGTMTGPITLPSDPAAPLQAATMQYVDAVRTYVANNFYTAPTSDTRYTYKTGDTMSGSLTVPYLHSTASIAADTDISVGSRLYTNDIMNNSGIFYVAGNYGYYFGRSGSDGNWYFVQAGSALARIDTAGNFWATAAVTATYVHSTGTLDADGMIHCGDFQSYGNVNLTNRGQLWAGGGDFSSRLRTADAIMCASGVFYVADNTNYYLARNSNDGAWRFVENGTINLTIDTGGNVTPRSGLYSNYIKSNGWLDCQDLHSYNSGQVDGTLGVGGAINCGDVRPGSCNGVYYGCYGHWFAFWYSYPNIYARLDGGNDVYLGAISDERFKQDIAPCEVDCLALIQRIPLYQFRYKDIRSEQPKDGGWPGNVHPHVSSMLPVEPALPDSPLHTVGFIAQRVYEVFPEAAFGGDEDDALSWGVHDTKIVAALVGAVQQLADRLDRAGVA